jgi:NADH-quinone oxidoreductase subunit G
MTANTRREAVSGGSWVVKRMMPRQNEWVNEIWICDKGRFGYHYVQSGDRLTKPLVRKGGELVEATWEEALDRVAEGLREAQGDLLTLAGGRLPNEDLFNLKALADGLGGTAVLYTTMAGGDLTAQAGVGVGTNFAEMGSETAILVVASDLQEEAPIWFLRVKQAADRGAKLVVVNPRPTKLERYASQVVRYPYGSEAATILAMVNALSAKRPEVGETLPRDASYRQSVEAAAKLFAGVENAVILFGSEGTGLESSQALAQACANLLVATNHVGRPNNGLVGVWQRANEQGAWDMGFRPVANLHNALEGAKAVYVAAADPAGDLPALQVKPPFLIVQELFLTETAKLADVVLPVQAFTEREGSFTSGERRVQRFYPATPELSGTRADFAITGEIGKRLGLDLESSHASKVMRRIATAIPDYADVSYQKLAQVVPQWPIVGRGDLYYGGTTYENSQGLGVQLAPAIQRGAAVPLGWVQPPVSAVPEGGLLAAPVTRLYDRGTTLVPSELLHLRLVKPYVALHPETAAGLKLVDGAPVEVTLNGATAQALARLDDGLPQGVVLVPRSVGIPINGPAPIQVRAAEPAMAFD